MLGAARIAPNALIKPARAVDGVKVVAVAARDPKRAADFARKHGVPRVLGDYAELIADSEVDAIYNPLPNGLHARWTLAAIAAGKHVLCEKPFTANVDEAHEVARAAAASSSVVMEAFHYRYHPLAERMAKIVREELGEVREVRTALCFPLPRFKDIRYSFPLAGGAMMDAGCYALHCQRLLGPGEPEVVAAQALTLKSEPRIDRAMAVQLRFPNGALGRVVTSMWSRRLLDISATVLGERGTLSVTNYLMPNVYHRLKVTVDGRTRTEKVAGEATYTHQLRAFAKAVGGETAENLTPPEDSVRTMGLIDAAYRAAGLPSRLGAERQ